MYGFDFINNIWKNMCIQTNIFKCNYFFTMTMLMNTFGRLYRVHLFQISKSPCRLGPQVSFIGRLFRNEGGEYMKTQVRHPDVCTCTSKDNNHTYISSLAHSHLQPTSHLNLLCWHLWNWFPMAARPIYCHKHWMPVTSCWHRTQSLLLVCIFPLAQ